MTSAEQIGKHWREIARADEGFLLQHPAIDIEVATGSTEPDAEAHGHILPALDWLRRADIGPGALYARLVPGCAIASAAVAITRWSD